MSHRLSTSTPPVIAAFIGAQTLGDFAYLHVQATSVARQIPGSKLIILYRDDRPYKNFINQLNPYVTATVKVPADPNFVIPIDWFDGEDKGENGPFDPSWYAQGMHKPDVLITPSMLDFGRYVPPPPRLRVPDRMVPLLRRSLVLRGLDENRWFACVHIRETGYEHRADLDKRRNVDVRAYFLVIAHIVQAQGGQVVRLGDPSMTPLPPIPNVVDLSREADNFPEEVFALSRARYFFGTDTGPTQLASALKVPMALTNALGVCLWNDGDVVLFKNFENEAGKNLLLEDLRRIGVSLLNLQLKDVRYRDNHPDTLLAVADHMFEITRDCPGWRDTWPEDPPPSATTLELPVAWRDVAMELDFTYWPPSGAS